MPRPRRLILLLVSVAVLLVVAGVAGWWFLIRDDAPSEADIAEAGETLESGDGSGDDGTSGGLDGTWTVDGSIGSFDDFSGTWAGYRAREELASIGANTAVGRTPDVTGSMEVDGDTVTSVEVEVDLTTLESDEGLRDRALASRGLEHDRFPTATFTLAEPLTVPEGIDSGEQVGTTATGALTLHGVTRDVTVDVEAQLDGDRAAVVGSAPIRLGDFDIEPPSGLSVLSVEDDATFEFQIFFTRA
ncbi:MAG: YceI family protein [Acidimicrobiia bacterium]